MSLESGRKIGLTASLIAVITPVVIVAAYVVSFLLLIASLATRTNSSVAPLSFPNLMIILLSIIGVISFAGIILFVLAMHRLSHYFNEPAIFKNVLYGFIINIVGSIISGIFFLILLVSMFSSIPSGTAQTIAFTSMQATQPVAFSFVSFVFSFLIFLGVAFILGVVSSVFYMRAFNKLGEKSGVNNFKTAGLLYMLGAVLTIIGVGALLTWIAWIFAALGFHSLKPTSTLPTYSTIQLPLTVVTQKRYCTYCGAENNSDALFCRVCGKQLQ